MSKKHARKSAWLKGFSTGYDSGFAQGFKAGLTAGRVQKEMGTPGKDGAGTAPAQRRPKSTRGVLGATVTHTEKIAPNLMRVCATSPDLVGVELDKTDSYIKILHVPAGTGYQWPFDFAQVRRNSPKDLRPVPRTVTLRCLDSATGDFCLYLVLHGNEGVASTWAATVKPGDEFGFLGPKGKWYPGKNVEHFVLAGDESASAAIANSAERIPAGATARVFIEVQAAGYEPAFPENESVTVSFIYRDGAASGHALLNAVKSYQPPAKKTGWFVRGNAGMVKELRHYLISEQKVDKRDVSAASYWRVKTAKQQQR